jgi:hypothetical protein
LTAWFEVIAKSVAVTVEPPSNATAPPYHKAEFPLIAQPDTATVESPSTATAPPIEAEFEVIVQSVAKMLAL